MDMVAIIIAILGSSGLFSFATFLITRYDSHKTTKSVFTKEDLSKFRQATDQISNIDHKIKHLEQDTCRLQLLHMFEHQPDNIDTILSLADHYFNDLGGNWYMSAELSRWAKEHNVDTEFIRKITNKERSNDA